MPHKLVSHQLMLLGNAIYVLGRMKLLSEIGIWKVKSRISLRTCQNIFNNYLDENTADKISLTLTYASSHQIPNHYLLGSKYDILFLKIA